MNDLYDNVYNESDVLNSLSTWPGDRVETIKTEADSSNSINEFQEDLKKIENNGGGDLGKMKLNAKWWIIESFHYVLIMSLCVNNVTMC